MTIAIQVAKILKQTNPNPKTELIHENEMQLAVAVALSAQTTDKKVNEVTQTLFKKYKSWKDFAEADLAEMQQDIYGVNFHKGKAARLIKMGQKVLDDFGGALPQTLEELTTIPGFARKSGNVMLNEAFDRAEGIVVDTHVKRVSNRLGLTAETNPVKVEKDLMAQIPKEYWRNISGAMVLHGRYVCTARKPRCGECALSALCPSVGTLP
jgi:endonuclease III